MAKNTHLEHLEDDIFNNGYAGAQNALNFLGSLRDMLTTGSGGGNTKVTVKWDGAPAIFCGIDPETDMFFVGTKSVFAKSEPKICYSEDDIDIWYGDHPIKPKLVKAYRLLSKLPINGVLQGDLLYTETPPIATMGGKKCYKFRPNTITYCVEVNSELGKKVGASELGIVFHTYYSGSTMASMNAGFGVDVSSLQGVKDVAVFSAQFQNVNGAANLTPGEKTKLNNSIAVAQRNLTQARKFLDLIGGGTKSFDYAAMFKIYFNAVIKEGRIPPSAQQMANGFANFVDKRYANEIAKKKTDKAKKDWEKKKEESLRYLNTNKSTVYAALSGFKNLMVAKEQIIEKLKKIEGIGTFLEDENGYRVTSPEGFVAIKDGIAMKLVDRLEFSRANFTVAKDWG
ncbi:hypothetical protein SSZBM1_141 [Synechococcus phage S-SZBM1]|uniref:Uncharacterized protein n=1 Tax=Synechococcus phage S-SZBM1 TaxID=2926475 RepID=A0AC61TSR4_9CAUD|nr:hypothetical protein PP650_gp135 [Synechococcus phage S-SZBM1]UNH61258.1 hypothetical protein SSZBM1_141 [Synechococcus phage S-SZBM1]